MTADAREMETLIAHLMHNLKARDYGRSELIDISVNPMSESLALVSVSRVRYKTDGGELERLGETYAFRKFANDWKIVTAMTHDPAVILRSR